MLASRPRQRHIKNEVGDRYEHDGVGRRYEYRRDGNENYRVAHASDALQKRGGNSNGNDGYQFDVAQLSPPCNGRQLWMVFLRPSGRRIPPGNHPLRLELRPGRAAPHRCQ